jgi:hypothetical protein
MSALLTVILAEPVITLSPPASAASVSITKDSLENANPSTVI